MPVRIPALSTAALLLVACTATEPSAPEFAATGPDREPIRLELAAAGDLTLLGVADAPPVDTDRLPEFELLVVQRGATRSLGITALDATLDVATDTLAWIDPRGTLWVAPLAGAPGNARELAARVLPGLAASRGRLAFAVRIDGPETAPFVADLATLRVTAVDDGPGPDEVLGWSPDGDQVLLLSGRTGLASLFAAGVDEPGVRQLTNVGLAPGPGLDPSAVAPSPIDRRRVAWGPGGIAYRAEHAVIRIEPDRSLTWLPADRAVEEVVR